jgi:hypothetical protein
MTVLVGLSYDPQLNTEFVTTVDSTTGAITHIGSGLSGVRPDTESGATTTNNAIYLSAATRQAAIFTR